MNGVCRDGRCICDTGWQGSACHKCGGRARLTSQSGYIVDGYGNYSTDLQCTWLIDSNYNNVDIRLQILQFETECSWDHLYIFDGDSVFAPMLAAYSGLLIKDKQTYQNIPEIVAHSGKAYLYFYSDAAYNMSGFNITYTINNNCSKNCSNHGVCISNSECTCNAGWDGLACDREICPNECSSHGRCAKEKRKCQCDSDYTGADCSQAQYEGYWTYINPNDGIPGRSLHQAVIHQDSMWVVGGELFNYKLNNIISKFDLVNMRWEHGKTHVSLSNVRMHMSPSNRFGHSAVIHQDKIYLFGGILTNGTIVNELWIYDIKKHKWDLVIDNRNYYQTTCFCTPLPVLGHTATVVDYDMIVIFGYNPVFGYLNTVQEFNFVNKQWQLVQTKGALVKGGFGHTSVYDHLTKIIYVYGGYHSYGASDTVLVDLLYGYNPKHKSWILLTPSQSPRYLHSAAIINGMMLIFGGNGHNTTHDNSGDRCFSLQFLAYDITCDSWIELKEPSYSQFQTDIGLGRYGHSSVVYNNSMYVFGGFNGIMLNSIIQFTPGDCYRYTMQDECAKVKPGTKCVWNRENSVCQPYNLLKTSSSIYAPCINNNANFTDLCQRQNICQNCIENSYGCVWCGDTCQYEKCKKSGMTKDAKTISDSSLCQDVKSSSNCDKLHNCHACHTEYYCGWQRDHKCYTLLTKDNDSNKSEKAPSPDDLRPICEAPCHTRTTCDNCTQGSCMWCSSLNRCVESNAYAAVFPNAQCMEWTIHNWKCSNLTCSDLQTCEQCLKNPRCGWCDDGTNTGVGRCLEGSLESAYIWNGTLHSPAHICPKSFWYFSKCPLCQCNEHSICLPGMSECEKPCKNLTEGTHCQHCMLGYFGNPINGGNCTPCFCNGHSAICNRENGKCHCTTKGIIGNHCEKCDEQNHYYGNPQDKDGSCFYNLTMGYQYTFNMSKPDDHFYSSINFMNIPITPDIDVEFTIQCRDIAFVNISIGSPSLDIRALHNNLECGNLKLRFSHDENLFGLENTTFYVNVYSFTTPFVLQISFSQHRTLDLLQFFVTFSSCFLTLLIIAAILWKIKQKYDLYRRRQQLFVEMEQMASRPFAGVVVQLNRDNSNDTSNTSWLKSSNPTPIALEPCGSGKAAVLSLIVNLPTGGVGSAPPGQTGLAIASALVSLGTMEQKSNKEGDSANSKFTINNSYKLNNCTLNNTTVTGL